MKTPLSILLSNILLASTALASEAPLGKGTILYTIVFYAFAAFIVGLWVLPALREGSQRLKDFIEAHRDSAPEHKRHA